MKERNLFPVLLLVFAALCVFGWASVPERVSGQSQSKIQQKVVGKKVMPAGKSEKAVPDNVAYELFLRTVGGGNAKSLVERIGLGEEATDRITAEAKNLNQDLENLDLFARNTKDDKNKSILEKQQLLNRAQEKKTESISRVVERFLPSGLGEENWRKFQEFIETEVKPAIQVFPAKRSNLIKTGQIEVAYLKTANSFANARQTGGDIYFYGVGSQAEMNVFGSGSLSEQYASDTSYRVTITVTSPSGRSNTTVSDWSYATLAHDTGLSVGVEDGTYSIQADFEQQDGYYDEYGNFVGTGSSFVGSSATSLVVAPTVTVESVSPNALFLRSNEEGEIVGVISTTTDVPVNTVVVVDIFGTSIPAFTYTVAPTNRRQTFTVSQPGVPVGVDFVLKVTSNTNQGANTNVTNKIRILSVAPPEGSDPVTASSTTQTVTLNYLGTPSPSPTPGSTVGNGGPRNPRNGNNQCPPPGQGPIRTLDGVK